MDKKLHILCIISGLWRHTGGPSTSVPRQCVELVRNGCAVAIATLDGAVSENVHASKDAGVNVKIFRPTFRHTIWHSNEMKRDLPKLAKEADIIHTHGLWEYPVWLGARIARESRKPLVMSLRGALKKGALKKSFWKKAIAGKMFDNKNLRNAACLHAQSETEKYDIRAYGLHNPVAIIPNGIDICEPDLPAANRENIDGRFPSCRGKRLLLFMSRINPTKGLLDLAEAWGVVANKFPEWHLLIAGSDERGHFKKVKEAFSRHSILSRMTYAGPLYGRERIMSFSSAELFILPTHTESFGMVIGEAFSAGLPVITTHGAPWEGISAHRCGWWVPMGKDGLISALNEALSLPRESLREMGGRGRAWVKRDFTWEAAAKNMIDVYQWLSRNKMKPDIVHLD